MESNPFYVGIRAFMLLARFAANSLLSLLVRRGYVGHASSSEPAWVAGPVTSPPTDGLGGVGLSTEKGYTMATLFQEVSAVNPPLTSPSPSPSLLLAASVNPQSGVGKCRLPDSPGPSRLGMNETRRSMRIAVRGTGTLATPTTSTRAPALNEAVPLIGAELGKFGIR